MPLSLTQRENNISWLARGVYGSGQHVLALSSTPIQPDGTGATEPVGNGYQRVGLYNVMAVPVYDDQDDTYSVTNDTEIQFNEATGSWGTLSYFAIFESLNSTNVLAYGTLTSPISPVINTIPVVRVGQLQISEVVQ